MIQEKFSFSVQNHTFDYQKYFIMGVVSRHHYELLITFIFSLIIALVYIRKIISYLILNIWNICNYYWVYDAKAIRA